jgi:hypothetical protein
MAILFAPSMRQLGTFVTIWLFIPHFRAIA